MEYTRQPDRNYFSIVNLHLMDATSSYLANYV
uniref:Uncharacterized protein n=1 Tax=Rhizophora mucronata TaxID=61149 RepID=A0A2P2QIK0_RHIMU